MISEFIPPIALGLFTGALLSLLAVALISRRKPRLDLDKIPLPPVRIPFVGHVVDIAVPHMHRVTTTFDHAYGPIHRYIIAGKDVVSVSDPEIAEEILGPTLNLPKQEEPYSQLKNLLGGDNLVTHMHNDDAYKSMRKTLAVAFSNDSLRKQYDVMRVKVRRLMEEIRGLEGQDVEIDNWLLRLTFDVICTVAFSTDMNALGSDLPYIKAMFHALHEITMCNVNPFRRVWLRLPFTNICQDYRAAKKIMTEVQAEMLRNLLAGRHTDDDRFIGAQLTRLKDHATGESLSLERLMPHFVTLLIAGFETTSHTMAWTLMEIAAHPEVQDKIHAELRSLNLLATPKHPSPPMVEYTQLKDLHYLNQVLKETMRVHPVVAVGTVRITVAPTRVGPYTIPADTPIWVPFHAMHTSPHNFLKADAFLPERWDPEHAAKHNEPSEHYPDATLSGNRRSPLKSMINFSDGPRSCVGTNMAYLQARLTLATLLANFRVELAPGRTREAVLEEQVMALTLQPGKGIHLRFTALAGGSQ